MARFASGASWTADSVGMVQISDSHRLLFVHVQKTGGNSVARLLGERIDDLRRVRGRKSNHEPLRLILRREPALAEYWTFGFVRNPWARMVSWWSMIQEVKVRAEDPVRLAGKRLETNDLWRTAATYPDFETFVVRGTTEFAQLRAPQLTALTTRGRRADFIGRQETFDADVRAVLARFNLPIPDETPRRNVSQHRPYRDYYTPKTRDLVGELFARDCEAFRYTF